MIKYTYKLKLFTYFFFVFSIFTSIIVYYQYRREAEYSRLSIETKLELYSHIVEINTKDLTLPDNLRVTIVNNLGEVTYDNSTDATTKFSNHLSRPEINIASTKGIGSDIRISESMGVPFFYYARKTASGYIRVALPYNIQIEQLLSADTTFIWLILSLFIIASMFLWYMATIFGNNLAKLKEDVISEKKARRQMKREMSSSIAHELRTPISAIRGYTETLKDDNIPEDKRKHFIERAHLASIRLSDLVRDISLLTKLDEKSSLFEKELFNIKDVIEDVLIETKGNIEAHDMFVENNITSPYPIKGNRTLIYSIFSNLIENSCKYAGKGTTIKLDIMESGQPNSYLFKISDNGKGVAKNSIERLFERFYRVDAGRARQDGGSGLGLAIVKHAVEYHEGEITAQQNNPSGLSIIFSLKTN